MDLGTAGLREQPFPTHGAPLAIITYQSQWAGREVLQETLEHPTGLSLIQGPSLSGRSILIRSFSDSIDEETAVAVVDGRGLNTTNLLLAVLRQFGYEIDLSSTNELLGLLRVFALQQATSNVPPLLVIENTHELRRSALRALSELAQLRARLGSALKIVLSSDRSLTPVVNAETMKPVAKRVLHDFHLHPMSREEARNYLEEKLSAAGADCPALIFPIEVCDEIWKASGGWPGIIDRVALLALAAADSLPVARELIEHPVLPGKTWDDSEPGAGAGTSSAPAARPQLFVTSNGSVSQELTLEKSAILIGRSQYNDISIASRFVSRHHVLLVRHGSSTFLMDLNSTNGTFVNAERVSNHVLLNDDVITVGHHKIKFSDPYATDRADLGGPDFADTVVMKTLEDMRNAHTDENIALLTAASEDLPTLQS
jgi:type II secretory pathway predicted ATPase ExeA